MTDDFIRELQAEWRAQPVDEAAVVGRLRGGRWTPQALFWLEVLQGVVGIVFGVAFLWLALDGDLLAALFRPVFEDRLSAEGMSHRIRGLRVVFAVGGAVMVTTVPPLAWAAVRARRGSLKWEDETPEGVLRVGLRRADASLRANRLGRWHVFVLLAFVAALWILPAVGLVPVYLTALMTLAYAASIAPIWFWLDARRERLRRELETCLRLLEEYGSEP